MIPNFRTFLKESVWMDIHKRSNGDIERKEDNINLLDFNGMYEYINNNYHVLNKETVIQYKYLNGKVYGLRVAIKNTNSGDDLYLEYMNNGSNYDSTDDLNNVIILNDYTDIDFKPVVDKLNKKFLIQEVELPYTVNGHNKYILSIRPKNGETDNRFFITVIDTIIEDFDKSQIYIYKNNE